MAGNNFEEKRSLRAVFAKKQVLLKENLKQLKQLKNPILEWAVPSGYSTTKENKNSFVMTKPHYHPSVIECMNLLSHLITPFNYLDWKHFKNGDFKKAEFYKNANFDELLKRLYGDF